MNITQAFKTDIGHVGDIVISSSGDIGTISGLANLKTALFHRLLTVPGTLVHRPTYGVGIMSYQNALSSFGLQQQLATLIQEQFKQDPRVQEVSSVSISNSDSAPDTVRISVTVKPLGYTDQQMTFTPFAGSL